MNKLFLAISAGILILCIGEANAVCSLQLKSFCSKYGNAIDAAACEKENKSLVSDCDRGVHVTWKELDPSQKASPEALKKVACSDELRTFCSKKTGSPSAPMTCQITNKAELDKCASGAAYQYK